MSLALRRSFFFLSLWLSLAIVLAPALDPVGSPLREVSGSAFNAFTSDVSLGPARAAPPERDRKDQALPAAGSDRWYLRTEAAVPAPPLFLPFLRLALRREIPIRSGAGPGGLGGRALPARAPPFLFRS